MRMTNAAVNKVVEIMEKLEARPHSLRVGVKGGGCSGFQYNMEFIDEGTGKLPLDKEFIFQSGDGKELKVFIDPASILYLENCEIDYVETLEGAGFKFNNPNTTSTCGCGSSFSA